MRYGTAQSYFSDVEKNLNPGSPIWNYESIAKGYTPPPTTPGKMGLPTWNDELYFEYHRGVYTSQAQHKRSNRLSEAATLNAEKLASFAWLYGQPYPAADLTENWKKITFNQFHDLAAGSGIAVIYRDAQDDYKQVFATDRLISEAARSTLIAKINTAAHLPATSVPIVVFNSLPWDRSESAEVDVQLPDSSRLSDVTDDQGTHLRFQVLREDKATHSYRVQAEIPKVPSLGYTLLHATSAAPPKDDLTWNFRTGETPTTYVLENAYLRVQINKSNGCLMWLQSGGKPTSQMLEYLAPSSCGNQLQAFKDTPKQYDAWNIDPGTLDVPPTIIDKVDSIKLVEDGPLRKTIRITRTWQSSHFIQDISLDAYSDTVRIDNTIDWHEKHILLKAAFPLAHSSDSATFEIPYGSITRPTTRNNSWEKAKFEVPALRWADLGDSTAGLSILNDSKYGYDAVGNTLRITLLRSPTWPDPDADQGTQHFTYELYPHTGTWKQAETVRRGYELNNPLTATQVFAHTGTLPPTHSFASVENKNVTLTAIKKAEDSDALVFRMYEWAGTPTDVKLHVPPGATYAVESNLMEKPEGPHLPLAATAESDTVTIPIKPYEILTVQVFYPTRNASAN
jgi:alpha-mannosidase